MNIVTIDCQQITSWETFHQYFKTTMGFPDFYGNNMNAWIDCMSYLDEDDGMAVIKIKEGEVLTLQLENVTSFANDYPEIYQTLIESSAFVNYRRTTAGDPPILALSFYNNH